MFWQCSEEVEETEDLQEVTKKPSRRRVSGMQVDVIVGMTTAVLIMFAILVSAASTLGAHGITNIGTADQSARALKPIAGNFAGLLFALGIVGTGALAAGSRWIAGLRAGGDLPLARGAVKEPPKGRRLLRRDHLFDGRRAVDELHRSQPDQGIGVLGTVEWSGRSTADPVDADSRQPREGGARLPQRPRIECAGRNRLPAHGRAAGGVPDCQVGAYPPAGTVAGGQRPSGAASPPARRWLSSGLQG